MSCIYISSGNIPSRWAHTFQTMKMAESYAQLIDGFRILIETDQLGRLLKGIDLRTYYGLERRLEIVPLRTRLIRFRPTHRRGKPSRSFLAAAIRYARNARPKMIFTRSYHVAECIAEEGLPLIFETHGSPDHANMAKVRKIAKAPEVRGIVTTLEYLRVGYIKNGVSADKILVRPNGVDLHRYANVEEDPRTLRSSLGLPLDGPIVIYTGHLYEHKGVRTLLEAARLLDECHVVLVGGWKTDVAKWRREYRSLSNILFTGFVTNTKLLHYIAAADVCVLPQLAENEIALETCPLKLFEYMAAARPIVVSDFGAIRQIVQHEENALLVRPGDVGSIVEAVKRLLADRALGQRIAERARADVRSRTWDQRAHDILATFAPELLRGSAGGHSTPGGGAAQR